ncbi:asparagine synthase (glutamine-hydrolyzing) [Ktedonobacter robiniae]|uniref:asparagine synthase (glutamine-hydrolyzing) n=1 Tax=Ktedonobacter robiniae TaxID=2778365 RepID=A0ABQ3V504_9CHLR|nr:asparagine synthase (glutamine-hydrolyzing) [Ktedonobacter robiniae]GHO60037.1 asparagine synthetase B [Ktedonobacter robiniae]
MCGIVGWIDWENDLTSQTSTLKQIADTLCHRGPDAQGEWLSRHAALAHRRLEVIDPANGGQPMLYQVGQRTYALTYNGELYNFRELKRELETRGYRFRTQSDTEVLLAAYAEWGEDCVQHFNGIFAFGLWDEQRQQLLLARDHLGVKPLYYAQRGNTILFGSELKALLAHPLIKAEVDVRGLVELFAFRHTPGSAIYRDIHELRPAHKAVCNHNGMRISRYWSLHSEPHTDDLPTTAEHIRTLLRDIVKRQLIADVPVVAMLSGGLDSSGLTALAAAEFKQEGKQLHTYSIDYVDSAQHFQGSSIRPSLDAPWVQRVSDYAGTMHHTVTVDTPELIENMLVPLHAYDLPGVGQGWASLYLLFKRMKQDAKVALSGESADEVFGGYPWFHSEAAFNAQTFPWMAEMATTRGSRHSRSLMAWLAPDVAQKVNPLEYMNQQYRSAIAEVPRLDGEGAREARMREIFYLNLTYFLPMLLDRKDLMSMATGFEVRVPFCDYRLVEYVWNIPWEMKTTGNIEKGILREALTGILPDDARKRKKSAYPTSQNPTYVNAVRDWTLEIVNDANAPAQSLMNTQVVRAVAEGKVPGLPDEATAFLCERVIQTNEWLKDYHVTLSV